VQISSLTVGMWRSCRIIVFGTYHGASTIRRRTFDGHVVFSAVHVISKESRRIILPRASWFYSDEFHSHIFGYNVHLLDHKCSDMNNIALSVYKCMNLLVSQCEILSEAFVI
jgi:hypothetical protein